MNETLIRCRARGALAGATCLLLAALLFLAGCGRQDAPPKAAAPGDKPADEGQAQAVAKGPAKPAGQAVEVGSCDGQKTVTVSETPTGQELGEGLAQLG